MKTVVYQEKIFNLVDDHPCFEGCKVYESKREELAITYPLPTQEQLLKFYQPGLYIKEYNLSDLEYRLDFSQKRALSQIEFMKPFFPKRESLNALDIGCSEGSLVDLLGKRGFNVTGYEPDINMAKFAINRFENQPNYHIIPAMFGNEETINNQYDLICSSHLFEHIPNPLEHLKLLKNSLNPEGILFMEIPNDYYLGVKQCINPSILPTASINGHLYFYSPNSVKKILEENGFKVLLIKTCGKNTKTFFRDQIKQEQKENKLIKKINQKLTKIQKYWKTQQKNYTRMDQPVSKSPFETYWTRKEQGQWIRVIATPE